MQDSWPIPSNLNVIDVNGYPLTYVERGSGLPVILVHGVYCGLIVDLGLPHASHGIGGSHCLKRSTSLACSGKSSSSTASDRDARGGGFPNLNSASRATQGFTGFIVLTPADMSAAFSTSKSKVNTDDDDACASEHRA